MPQSITFRLAGSLPADLIRQWREKMRLGARPSWPPGQANPSAAERQRIEDYLNQGIGPTWLADTRVASLVQQALLHFDGARYRLHAWVVMPNHVHVVATLLTGLPLSGIVSSWKSYTAVRANELLGRSGPFWQADYFDRFIRNERHFLAAVNYVENNPVAAGLCATPEEWPFSSAYLRNRETDILAP